MKHHRRVTSEKLQFINILDTAFAKASSQQSFFKTLEQEGLKLYTQRGTIRGVKRKRKFRLKSLGYDTEILKLLDKKIEKNVRLGALRRIREQGQEHSLGRERIRKRGH